MKKITLYSLTTCSYCQALKKMYKDLELAFDCLEVDQMDEAERREVLSELKKVNSKCSFPTTVIGSQPVVGYKPQEIKEIIGIRTETDDLYDTLKKIHEPKGFFFNADREHVFALLRGLLINRSRYGHMACPCRLASGDLTEDLDIICPCAYRAADVEEFGSCYCALYVSEQYSSGEKKPKEVPERRPETKT